MKGVILAGGKGTRLLPLTKVTNKHLLPVYNRPMIYYPIQTLTEAGIRELLIISGPEHAGHFLNLLGSGRDFGAHFSYEIQEEAGGIAQALSLAEDFADGGKIAVMLGDNIIRESIRAAKDDFERQERGAKVFLTEVDNPSSFGIATIENAHLTEIVEKPKKPKSNLAVVGIYFYDAQVFSIIRELKPSARGEMEISDVNSAYLRKGTLTYERLKGFWGDGGESFDSLLRASRLVAEEERQRTP